MKKNILLTILHERIHYSYCFPNAMKSLICELNSLGISQKKNELKYVYIYYICYKCVPWKLDMTFRTYSFFWWTFFWLVYHKINKGIKYMRIKWFIEALNSQSAYLITEFRNEGFLEILCFVWSNGKRVMVIIPFLKQDFPSYCIKYSHFAKNLIVSGF